MEYYQKILLQCLSSKTVSQKVNKVSPKLIPSKVIRLRVIPPKIPPKVISKLPQKETPTETAKGTPKETQNVLVSIGNKVCILYIIYYFIHKYRLYILYYCYRKQA